MGNVSSGTTSESGKVVARCPERKSRAEVQSLKPGPAFSSGSCNRGMANAPTANTGASLSNSRRVTFLNFRESIRVCISNSAGSCSAGVPQAVRKASRPPLMRRRQCSPSWDSRVEQKLRRQRSLGLALYSFPDELSKLPHILLSRIERAHPAHHGLLFVPYIEEVPLLQLGNRRSWDLSENSIGLHFVNNLHLWNLAEFLLQQTRHAIGVLGTLQPEIAGEQGIKLRRNEAHFGCELHALLAQI